MAKISTIFKTYVLFRPTLCMIRHSSGKAGEKFDVVSRPWNITLSKTDDESAYTIKLNEVNLKTPMKNLLKVRNETLALAIANEWKSKVGKKKIDLKTMHLTTLTYNAIDNPFKETKEQLVDATIEYLKFDTVRFRDVDQEELLKLESQHWDPIVGWFEHKFNVHLPIDYGDIANPTSIPKSTIQTVARNLNSLDRWPLVGVRFIASNLKSYALSTCLTERFLTVEKTVELARLETKFQTQKWSVVEWEHDLDEQTLNARAVAGTLFYHFSL